MLTFPRNTFCYDGGEPAGGTDPNGGGTPPVTDPTPPAGGDNLPKTQEEFDAALERRLARERKNLRKEFEDEQAAKIREAQMTEAEKLKNAKDEAEKNAAETTAKANARIVKAEAKVLAASLGNEAHASDIIALAGITGEEIGDDGEPDTAALTDKIQAVIATRPFYAKGAAITSAGGDINPGSPLSGDVTKRISDAMTAGNFAAALELMKQQ